MTLADRDAAATAEGGAERLHDRVNLVGDRTGRGARRFLRGTAVAEEAGAEHAVGRGNGRAALLGLLEQATDRAADQAPDGRAARDRDEASDRAADRRARLALLYADRKSTRLNSSH